MVILRFPKNVTKKEITRALVRLKHLSDVYAVNYDRPDSVNVICDSDAEDDELLKASGAIAVIRSQEPYVLAGRAYQKIDTDIPLNGHWQRTSAPLIIGGPCSVEDRVQVL